MRPYVVKQGDYLEKIAHALGADPEEIWNDPKNADIKKQRAPNLLHPGDILYVPDPEPRWLPLAVGSDNLYVAKVPRTTIRLTFKNHDKPLAGEPYVIRGMGEPEEGKTDGEGTVVAEVPVHVREIQVTFPESNLTYPVRLGDMDPIDEDTGVRKRLDHLGYYDGLSCLDEADRDRWAITSFQHARGLDETGRADDATRAALVRAHGS
jgi:hypothetical protein